MAEAENMKYQNLTDALEWYDENTRLDRAKRIDWASSLYSSRGLVSGEVVPMGMIEEARISFVNGQYLATVLCATSVVEHLLVAELEASSATTRNLTLGGAIKVAENAQMYSPEIIRSLRELNEFRNPLAHRRDADDPSTLANRYLAKKIHPESLKEQDARRSLEVMYQFFVRVLRTNT